MTNQKKVVAVLVQLICVAAVSIAQAPHNADNDKIVESLGHMGVATGKLIYSAATTTNFKPTADAGSQLQNIVDAYKSQRDAQRGTVGLLNTTFEVVLVGTDVATAGESVLATSGVRYVKNQALGALTSRMDNDAQ